MIEIVLPLGSFIHSKVQSDITMLNFSIVEISVGRFTLSHSRDQAWKKFRGAFLN